MSEALPFVLFPGCSECGAGFGEPHWPDCGATRALPDDGSDLAQAIRTCRERGWAVVHVPGEGFRPCHPAEPGSYVDLDRYYRWLEHGPGSLDGNEP